MENISGSRKLSVIVVTYILTLDYTAYLQPYNTVN